MLPDFCVLCHALSTQHRISHQQHLNKREREQQQQIFYFPWIIHFWDEQKKKEEKWEKSGFGIRKTFFYCFETAAKEREKIYFNWKLKLICIHGSMLRWMWTSYRCTWQNSSPLHSDMEESQNSLENSRWKNWVETWLVDGFLVALISSCVIRSEFFLL